MTDLTAVIAELRAIVEKATPRVGQDEDWRAIKSLCKSAPAMLDVVEAARRSRPGFSHESERVGWHTIDEALAALAKETADG